MIRVDDSRDLVRGALPAACQDLGLNWIGGEWRAGAGGETFATIDPSTGMRLHELAVADASDVAMAIGCADTAQRRWWALDGQDRARILWNVARGLRAHSAALGLLDTLDAGRQLRDTQGRDAERAARIFEFFAGVTDRLRGASIPVQAGFNNTTTLEPYGVVGAIIPWNYPLTNAATKVAPALATGNGVVLKPAEDTPLSALLFAQVLQEAGVPDGLFNIVNGPGPVTGAALVAHPGVHKIAFTGSTDVGRHIGAQCGRDLKGVTLELGGKSPIVIFNDADVERAANAAMFSFIMNQGQTCTATTRLIVERGARQTVLDTIRASARRIRIGDPLDRRTHVGPLVSRQQFERIERYLEIGTAQGATASELEVDWQVGDLAGHFHKPYIFTDVSSDMRIYREEIFGPALVVTSFDDEQEAVSMANLTEFGLAASVWTSDLQRAHRFAASMQSGIVWINTIHSLHPGSPYGGWKQSGLGLEMGSEAVQQFMRTKSTWTAIEPWRSPWAVESLTS
jgi:acyl-CoA reductase-like NAD-dependent aldehyde dehydrogenase